MASHYSFTVPIDKENFNPSIKKFVSSQIDDFDYVETKDGFGYSLEFDNDNKRITFKEELEKRFSKLYY